MNNGVGRRSAKTKRNQEANNATVLPGSGNVFADLAVPNAEEALAKAKLAHKIGAIIAERDLTQAESAEILGIDQPKVSALLRGQLRGFSSDRLFRFLNALGRDVEIVIRTPERKHRKARTRVRIAS